MAPRKKPATYDTLVREAVRDFASKGYTGPEELSVWLDRIRNIAQNSFKPVPQLDKDLAGHFGSIYKRVTDTKHGPKEVKRYSRSNLTKEALEELNKRIAASSQLIQLNREEAVASTLRRLTGWATSIPPGGVSDESNKEATQNIVKSLKQLPFEERRVIIDQGHKFNASLEEVVSKNSGAIAGIWHSHVGQAGYNFRKDHAARNELIYLIKGSWADKAGLVKSPLRIKYTNQQTAPAEEPFCRCYYQYVYNLQDLPTEYLTQKGLDFIKQLKERNR